MNREQLDQIPNRVLKPNGAGCHELIDWLASRGWQGQMSLLELDNERRRRGIRTPAANRRPRVPPLTDRDGEKGTAA